MDQKKRSPWVYIGIGCGGLIVLGIIAVCVLVFGIFRWGKGFEAQLKDPAVRQAAARRELGTDKMPDGYYLAASIPIPLVDMSALVISDTPPGPDGQSHGYGERGFLYFRGPYTVARETEFNDFYVGRLTQLRTSYLAGFIGKAKLTERLGNGTFESGGATVRYVAQRGDLTAVGGPGNGLAATISFACPLEKAKSDRVAVWFTLDPDPTGPVTKAEFKGTAADPDALKAFLSAFHVCGASGQAAPPAP